MESRLESQSEASRYAGETAPVVSLRTALHRVITIGTVRSLATITAIVTPMKGRLKERRKKMAEGDDYTPATWSSGDSFASARAAYDAHAGRSYAAAATSGKTVADLLPRSITTQSPAPIVIVCDVTGSMGEWPATIFSKLPYLDHEMKKEYFGEGAEICFAAVGDAFSDKYPLQASEFAKGEDMEARLKSLVVEGGGGGGGSESYELAALYFARNCSTPMAMRKPIFIMIGDELPYDTIAPDISERYAHTAAPKYLTVSEVFQELSAKYSVYYIRKPYGRADESDPNAHHQHKVWSNLVGADRVVFLPEASRVVDVIFGIFARETGKIEYFAKELADRQTPAQVKTVMKSLATVHAAAPPPKALVKGASTLHKPGTGTKTKPLA